VHFTPDGRFAYMLRVSPDGKEVWVQTAGVDTNVVLSAEDLSTLVTLQTGKGPLHNAWTPDARYSLVTNSADTFASVFGARTYREVARLAVGQGGTNVDFTRDGSTGFMSATNANAVAVIDMANLNVASQLKAGSQPQGLIVL
jgi:DNA-binding beta-propeller fold protein YncE